MDDSTLNLRDLNKIKESFLKILVGIHHSRLRYPEQETALLRDETPPTEKGINDGTKAKPSTEKRLQRTIDSIDRK